MFIVLNCCKHLEASIQTFATSETLLTPQRIPCFPTSMTLVILINNHLIATITSSRSLTLIPATALSLTALALLTPSLEIQPSVQRAHTKLQMLRPLLKFLLSSPARFFRTVRRPNRWIHRQILTTRQMSRHPRLLAKQKFWNKLGQRKESVQVVALISTGQRSQIRATSNWSKKQLR